MYVCVHACVHACMHARMHAHTCTHRRGYLESAWFQDQGAEWQRDPRIRINLIRFQKGQLTNLKSNRGKTICCKKTNSETKVLLSCTAGPLAGHHIFVTEMSSYWMHQSGVTYKGVARCLVSRCRCSDSCVVWLDTNLVHSPAAA